MKRAFGWYVRPAARIAHRLLEDLVAIGGAFLIVCVLA